MTVVALQSICQVALVGEFLAVGRDAFQSSGFVDVRMARAALVIIVHLVAICTHILVREEIVEPGNARLDTRMTIVTKQLDVFHVQDMIEIQTVS